MRFSRKSLFFSQFWFQAFFSGPGFFPRLRVKALSLSSDPGPESIIWGKIVHFLPQMRQNLRQNASPEAKCEAFCLKWGKNCRDVRILRQNVPGRREFEAKRPGTLGRWARDVGTLGPNVPGRWDVLPQLRQIRPRASNQICNSIKIHIST